MPRQFKFELGWLHRDGFSDMVKRVWERPVPGLTPIQRWNNKISALRKHLNGWARHMVGQLKNEKLRLSSIIDDLEAAAEVRPLSTQEINLKIVLIPRWRVFFVKRRSNDTNDQMPNLFWKEM